MNSSTPRPPLADSEKVPPVAEGQKHPPLPDEQKKKNVRLAVILLGMSLFMFVSFIVKTALKGP